jgi:RNA polymerase sigma factor (sigma-70 family)
VPIKGPDFPDWESVDQVYGEYRQALKEYFKRRGFHADADDLVQLVYWRLMRQPRLEEIREPKKLIFWLARLVMASESPRMAEEARLTISLDASASEESHVADSRLPPDSSCEDVNLAEFQRHLAALRPEQVRVFYLYYFENLSIPEVASRTGFKKDLINKYLKQARWHLRQCYGDDTLGSR